MYDQYTINGERFAGLNIHSFSPMKFFTGILEFVATLASSVYYLTIAKYSRGKLLWYS